MITCPHCGKPLLVFLDIPGEQSEPQQPGGMADLTHRFQTCQQGCNRHTKQTLVEVEHPALPGRWGKWRCDVCGRMAVKYRPWPGLADGRRAEEENQKDLF